MIILYILIGFLLATIGITILNSISEVISAITEWIKAAISVKIVQHNATITKINNEVEKTPTRAIGFAISNEEEEDYD